MSTSSITQTCLTNVQLFEIILRIQVSVQNKILKISLQYLFVNNLMELFKTVYLDLSVVSINNN